MSRELMYPLDLIYKKSGVGSVSYANSALTLTGYAWASDDNYIEINPSGNSFYYDIIYSNAAGSQLYLGFERYDANKTATSNNSCVYVISQNTETVNSRIRGTVNLSTDVLGSPTKYIKLRILNAWNTSSNTTYISSFKLISLREANSITAPEFKKSGIIIGDSLREDSVMSLYKNGFVEAATFIEN